MPLNFDLNLFRAAVLYNGLAKTNRFEVEINAPNTSFLSDKLVSLYCESAILPQVNIATRQYKIYGPSEQRPKSIEYGGEGVSMTFYVDRSMVVKNYFDRWVHQVITPGSFNVQYAENYMRDIVIKQIDDDGLANYRVKLIGAYPRSINMMEVNNSALNQTHRLTVIFAYRYWETETIGHGGTSGSLEAVNFEFTKPKPEETPPPPI